jgi:hypothetical protein
MVVQEGDLTEHISDMKIQILQSYINLEEATREILLIAKRNEIKPAAAKLKAVANSFAEIVSTQWAAEKRGGS